MVDQDQDQDQAERRPAEQPPPRVGLLDHLTATSLDEDYADVSARRRSTPDPPEARRPGLTALVVLAVFGVLVATAAVQTSRDADESASSRASLVGQVNARKADLAERRVAIRSLQSDIAAQQVSNLAAEALSRELQARLSRLGVVAGTAPTRGPGIRVVVDDAPNAPSVKQQVQSPDLQKLVNGLWQVGAEAISIDDQRLTSVSAIRDAGSAVTVNFKSLRRPYVVSAIGNPMTMGAELLDTAGGETWVTLQSTFGLQFEVETKDSMLLPAAKPVTLRSAREPASRR